MQSVNLLHTTSKPSKRTWFAWIVAMAILAVSGFSSYGHADWSKASLAPYVRCFEVVSHNEAPGRGRGVVVMVGSRIGSHGLYAFDASNVYYQPVPFASGFHLIRQELPYFYEIHLPGRNKVYVKYEPVSTVHEIRLPSDKTAFRPFSRRGLGVLDIQFQEALVRDLTARTYAWMTRFQTALSHLTIDHRRQVATEHYGKLNRCYRMLPKQEGNESARRALYKAMLRTRQLSAQTRPIEATLRFPWPPKLRLPSLPFGLSDPSK